MKNHLDCNGNKKPQEITWNWAADQKSFEIKARHHHAVLLQGLGGSVQINGEMRSLADSQDISHSEEKTDEGHAVHHTQYTLRGIDCLWNWKIQPTPHGLEISTTLHNTGSMPLTLEHWNILHLSKSIGGNFQVSEAPDQVRFFRWRSWDMRVELLSSEEGLHHSENLCHLFDPLSKQTFLSAFSTMDRMRCHHQINYSKDHGIQEYKATCDFGKYELAPGQKLDSEKLYIAFYESPYAALEGWAECLFQIKKPVFPELPPVGLICQAWTDTYNDREGDYTEVHLENARAVREKLKGFEIRYLRPGGCVAPLKDHIPGNWIVENHKALPKGLKHFSKEVQELGFELGLWVSPFWFCGEAEEALKENKENLLCDREGNAICEPLNWAGDFGDTAPLSELTKYYLDATHPKTLAFIKKVFAYYREAGIRFYMLDFLGVPENCRLRDPSQTPLQAATEILKAIRETAGKDTHLQTAVSSTPGFSGLINAARVGRDFGEGRPLQGSPLSDFRNATFALHDRHYANTHYLLQNGAASYFTHRKLYINDLNLLSVDKPIPLEHARISITTFGLCGTPLMLADDYRRINEERLRMVKLCLPRTQNMPIPVDLFENVYPDNYCRYLKLSVETLWDSYLLVAVFNMDDTAYDAELDFAKLGLDPADNYRLYEFWTEEYCGTYTERFKAVVPPNACRLFRISKAKSHPWLLTTDMHIQQGAVELKSLQWDEKKMRLSGVATRPAGEVGNLFFLMPRKMRVINDKGLWLLKELIDMNVIIRKEIKFKEDCESFDIFFEPWEEKYVTARPLMPYATEAQWLEYAEQNRKPGDTRVIE